MASLAAATPLLLAFVLVACTDSPTATSVPQPTATKAPAATSAPQPTSAPAPTSVPATGNVGTVEMRVTDAPPQGVSRVMISASGIEAQRSGAQGDSGWTTIVENPPVFDLVAVNGLEEILGSNKLPEGSYNQVRLEIKSVTVTLQGQDKQASVPSDKLRVVGGFQVAAGKTTVLTLDFDADQSVVIAGPNIQFKPVVKLLVQQPSDKPEPPKKPAVVPTATPVPQPTATAAPAPTATPTPAPVLLPIPELTTIKLTTNAQLGPILTGQNVGNVWFVLSSAGGPIQPTAKVNITINADLGTFLVDLSGRTMYLYTRDEPNKSNCYGNCVLGRPPLLTIGNPTSGDGVTSSLLSTTTRTDGTVQVTYNKWPLYYYTLDEKSGDVKGQKSGNVWYVLTPEGNGCSRRDGQSRSRG